MQYYPKSYQENTTPYPHESGRKNRPINKENLSTNESGEVIIDTEYNKKEEIKDVLTGKTASDIFSDYENQFFETIDNTNSNNKPERVKGIEQYNRNKEKSRNQKELLRTLSNKKAPIDAVLVKEYTKGAVRSSDKDPLQKEDEAVEKDILPFFEEEEDVKITNKKDKNGRGTEFYYTKSGKLKIKKTPKGNIGVGHVRFFQKKKELEKDKPSNRDRRHDDKVKVYNGRKNQGSKNERQYTKRELKEIKKKSA